MVHDGPAEAMLGTVGSDGMAVQKMWMDPVTENPSVGDTEVWEFYNFTADAHPMHVHEVAFEVVNRQGLVLDPGTGEPVQPVQLAGNATAARSLGERLQGHGDRLSGRGHAHPGTVQDAGAIRVALPHRRARGQRDDAAVPYRAGAAGPAYVDSGIGSPRRRVSCGARFSLGGSGGPKAPEPPPCVGLAPSRRSMAVVGGAIPLHERPRPGMMEHRAFVKRLRGLGQYPGRLKILFGTVEPRGGLLRAGEITSHRAPRLVGAA